MAYPYRMIRAFRGFRITPYRALYCCLFFGAIVLSLWAITLICHLLF